MSMKHHRNMLSGERVVRPAPDTSSQIDVEHAGLLLEYKDG